ncbi:MAG: aldehyde dehydrogenase family protein [Fusobacteriaceae bacterium]
MENLIELKKIIKTHKKDILEALNLDLGKSEEDALLTEYIPVIKELDLFIKKASKWKNPKRVWGLFSLFGCRSYTQRVPYGDVLIISPWNYPFQLALLPIIGALGSGNRVTLKPSELSSNTEKVLAKIIHELDIPQLKIATGDYHVAEKLLKEKFDYIFFTGSTAVGKLVYIAAAQNLTPVTLELGGKSPVVIEPEADLKDAVEKILWGKLLNSGQTCIAPDYVYLPEEKIQDFLNLTKEYLEKYPVDSGKIINERHYRRLTELAGGNVNLSDEDKEKLRFPFTIISNPAKDSPIMEEEIFGPLLPIIGYDSQKLEEVYEEIKRKPRPLALYIFRKDSKNLDTGGVVSGGLCINGTVLQVAEGALPFGGVGESGLGNYHGKHSFYTFTHEKAILESTSLKIEFFRKISSWMIRIQK